jgi:hypothetical protein
LPLFSLNDPFPLTPTNPGGFSPVPGTPFTKTVDGPNGALQQLSLPTNTHLTSESSIPTDPASSSATNQAMTQTMVVPVPLDTITSEPQSQLPVPSLAPGAPFDKSFSSSKTILSSFPSSMAETFVPPFREPSSPPVASSPSQIFLPSDATSASPAESTAGSAQARTSALHTIIGVGVGGGLALVLLVAGVVAARVRYQRILEREMERGKATR